MANNIEQPCRDSLSAACFLQNPKFARQALSFRLLSAFVPPALSRKLLTFLGLIRFDPAGNLPDWLDLPPWWIIMPDAVIPPDWKFGDPLFDGLFVPPVFGPVDEFSNPFGPWFLTPGGSGPTRYPNFSSPVVGPWFYDVFSSLDLTVWEKWLDGAATIALDGSGNVKFISTGTDYCILRTAPDATIPDKWVWTFRVKIDSHAGANPNFFCLVQSGSHAVKIMFNPPTTIWHATGGGSDEITVDNYVGKFIVISVVYDGGYTDLYLDGVLISSNQHHQHYGSGPGRISFDNNNEITCLLDYISIDPN